MPEFLPLLIVGAIIGTISAILIIVFSLVKDKKQEDGIKEAPKREVTPKIAKREYPKSKKNNRSRDTHYRRKR